MSAKQTTKKPNPPARLVKAMQTRTMKYEIAPVDLTDGEVDAAAVLAGCAGGIEAIAKGPLAPIAMEGGKLTERGVGRVRGVVKFLTGLLDGKKHKEAMSASKLNWIQINAFLVVSPEFARMYEQSKNAMFHVGEMEAYDTARELSSEGENVYDKEGNGVGKKRAERMTEVMLPGRYRKNGAGGGASGGDGSGGGITLNFHFDGKGKPSVTAETVDV